MLFITANIFQPLIDVFESVLKFFHDSVGVPWGWSILLLTVCVRALLVPLTIKQLRSMARLQTLQPEMKAIQAKYKEDKQRQQQEMMKFYKENNVNPLGSCLPMVAQLPVFISLYYMLRQSLRTDICPNVQRAFQEHYAAVHKISLHAAAGQTTACKGAPGASFLFIHDLTSTATGVTLIVLIILYIGSQLGSSLLMSSATMDPTQRRIMMFLPVVFVLFVIRFPAGLLVYWITTNFWTIGQQYVVKRRLGPMRAAAAGVPGEDDTAAGAAGTVATQSRPGRTKAPDRGRPPSQAASGGDANGGGAAGGLGALIRKAKPPEEKAPVATTTRGGTPPRPPRKKKKRSGRRR